MKCVNCNGEVDSQAIKCPYCGSRNEAGIQFNKQVYEKIHRNRLLAPMLLKQQTPELIQKLLTRIILAMLGISLVLFGICIVMFLVMDGRKKAEPEPGSYAEAYEEARHYKNDNYFALIDETNQFIDAWETGNQIDKYDVAAMIESSYRVIHDLEKLDVEYQERAMLEVEMIYQDILGLTREEMALFDVVDERYAYYDELPDETREQLVEIVCSKLGGLIKE